MTHPEPLSVIHRTDLRQKLDAFLELAANTRLTIGRDHEFQQITVVKLLDGDGLSDWLLEPLLELLLYDLSHRCWDSTFGAPPAPQRPLLLERVLVMKQRVCNALAGASGVESKPALMPRLKSFNNRWCHAEDGRAVSD